jgi:hypothetical protein
MSATKETKETKIIFDLNTNNGLNDALIGYLRAKKAEATIGVIMSIFAKAFMERDSIEYDDKNPLGSLVAYLKAQGLKNGDDAELDDGKGMKLIFSLDRKPNSDRVFLNSASVSGEGLTIQYGKGESVRGKKDDENVIREKASYLIFRKENDDIEHLYLQKDMNFQYFGNGKPRADHPTKERPPRADHTPKERPPRADHTPKERPPRADHTPKERPAKAGSADSTTDQSAMIQVLLEQNRKLMEIVAKSVEGPSKGKGKAPAKH